MDGHQAFAGVAINIYIGSKLIAYATGVSISEEHNNVYNEVLGLYDPVEIIGTGRRISIACRLVRAFNKSLTKDGVWPKGNNADFIQWGSTRFEVYNIIERKVMFVATGVKPGRLSWSIEKNTLSASNATFLATSLYDESQINQ